MKRKHEEYEIYGLVPTYEQLKKRRQWDETDSATAINAFLNTRHIAYSATDEVDEAMADLCQLFTDLDNYVDAQDGQVGRISEYFNQIEDQVITGNEHLERAFINKQQADRQRAILMVIGMSTLAFAFFFGGGFLLISLITAW